MRLLSYNIHKGIGGVDRRYNLERICKVIEQENPDLICLQEVTQSASRTDHHDQPAILANHFQTCHCTFQMNVQYRTGGYGNLVLSRFPFHQQHHISLQLQKRKPRGAQIVVVDTPQGSLHLTNWHLGLAEKERHWQVQYLLEHPTFCNSAHLPTMIVGDFNDWRNTLAEAAFAEHEFEQVTSSTREFRSFPAFLPMLTLDKAFHRGGVVVNDVRVVRSRLAFWASDHLPLVIDFQLQGDRHAR